MLSVTRVFGDGCVMKINVSDPVSVLFDAPPSRTVTGPWHKGRATGVQDKNTAIQWFSSDHPQINPSDLSSITIDLLQNVR